MQSLEKLADASEEQHEPVSKRVFKTWTGTVRMDGIQKRGPPVIPDSWMRTYTWKTDEERCKYGRYHPSVQALLRRDRIPQHTKEWFEQRQCLLTASGVSSILNKYKKDIRGWNKYTSYAEYFRMKTGRGKPFAGNKATKRGSFYEGEAGRVLTLVTGIELVPEDIGLVKGIIYKGVAHDDVFAASPDFVACYEPLLIETKVPLTRDFRSNRDVPDHYWTQMQMQMAVTGIHRTLFVQYEPPDLYTLGHIDIQEVAFDVDWFRSVVGKFLSFWEDVKAFYKQAGKPLGTPMPRDPPRQRKRKSPPPPVCKVIPVPDDAQQK